MASADRTGTESVVRRHYVLGLRDEVPAPKRPWSVYRHPPTCTAEDDSGLTCGGHECQRADICRLVPIKGEDVGFPQGLADIATVLGGMTGRTDSPPRSGAIPRRRTVAVVGSAWNEAEDSGAHFDRCVALLHDTVKALRHATQARTPNVTRERLWPLYVVVDEDSAGAYTAARLVVIEGGFHNVATASASQTERAERTLLAAWQRNPVETYLDFELDARRAADTDGDYVEAVLKAAAAAEVLIKHTAWMLTWEATTLLPSDPEPSAGAPGFAGEPGKPRTLIGSILARRLKGSWDSSAPTRAIGAWRVRIAQLRNAVMHRGYRPDAAQGHQAVAALDALEKHIVDRLASMAHVYPRTALLLAGRDALEKRGDFGKARGTYESESLSQLLTGYLAWLDGHIGDDVD